MEPNSEISQKNSSSKMQSTVSNADSSFSKKKTTTPSRYHGNRRIRLPYDCARSVFQLGDKLGHERPGQTIEWLINEAKSSVIAVLEGNNNPVPPLSPPQPPLPPTVTVQTQLPPPGFVPFAAQIESLTPTSISQLVNVSYDLDEEIAKYFRQSD